jgi:hypothetical protein
VDEPRVFESADVQYNHWRGTAALDDPHDDGLLETMTGFDPKEWTIMAVDLWGGRVGQGELVSGVRVYVSPNDGGTGDDIMAAGEVTLLEIEIRDDELALALVRDCFKRWGFRFVRDFMHEKDIRVRSSSTTRAEGGRRPGALAETREVARTLRPAISRQTRKQEESPVRFTKPAIEEMAARITQFGLQTCPVCDSGTLGALRRPILLPIGGGPWLENRDAGTNVLFIVAVCCDLCGHTLLFDSEKFSARHEPILEGEDAPG